MAENKKSFVLYVDQKPIFDSLTDTQAGKLIKHIYRYVNDENPSIDDQLLTVAFIPIKMQLKRDLKRWEQYIDKQRINGKKGGRPSLNDETQKTQAFFEKPKKADNVNVTVNVNDTVTDNVNVKNKTKILLSQVDKSTLDEKTKYYFEIAFSFWQLVINNLSELNIKSSAVENADFEKWISPIRMLIEKDKRTIDEIRQVFQFIRDDDFWRGQIQSTSKLRKKNKDDITYFEYLLIKSKNAGSKKSNSKTGKSNSGVSEDYQNSVFERLLHSPGE